MASFGGKRSYVPELAPASESAEDAIMHSKESVWNNISDPFRGDGDIIDHQTAILQYDTGASMAFHTNLNVPDEHRRFCVMGTLGMVEGDFVRGYLKGTKRDGTVFVDKDYTKMDAAKKSAHYGADHMMVADVVAFLRGEAVELPVGIVDALEAGLVALALDKARVSGEMVDMSRTWAAFDAFGLRG